MQLIDTIGYKFALTLVRAKVEIFYVFY